ncbi:unnamed protein product [Plutella xylostella]|uniref:(diamondback moth) hypothetical protein n=1 Tax=Plutella xylostella TaxID=51655 RepID=A0A8S4G218_PLUXY|nr:unnamed protein product [Plutella xylostella]
MLTGSDVQRSLFAIRPPLASALVEIALGGKSGRIEAVQTTPGLLPRLVALLEHRSAAVKTPALRAVGNMLTGSDVQTDRCLDAGCLPPLLALLQCSKPSLVKEGAWAMSNVLAGTHAQIQRAIDGGALALLAALLDHADVKCQKEAAWAITNLCLGGAPAQLDRLFAVQFLEPYTRLLASPDHRAAAVVLDGLTHLLQVMMGTSHTRPSDPKLGRASIIHRPPPSCSTD